MTVSTLFSLRLLILWCAIVYFIPLIDEAIYIQNIYDEYSGLCTLMR
jgi:hypothetical protein